jgi:F-type H+-transporting ATPase subunit b
MKIPGLRGIFRTKSTVAMISIMAIVLLFAFSGAWASTETTHGAAPEGEVSQSAAHGGPSEGAEGGGHGGGHGIQWKATDWARVLNFILLAGALFLILRKPIGQALNNRIKGIQEELADLESRKANVEKHLAEYNEKLKLMDKEAEQIIAEYVRQGEEAKARILKEAEAAAEKLEAQAKKNIAHEFANAKQQLQADIMAKALAKAEKIIAEQISAEDQGRLVDEYLDKVVA